MGAASAVSRGGDKASESGLMLALLGVLLFLLHASAWLQGLKFAAFTANGRLG